MRIEKEKGNWHRKKFRNIARTKSNTHRPIYRGADKSLARPGRKEARKHVRDARDLKKNRDASWHQVFPPLQGKAPKEIQAILTETLACFLPGPAKDLSAPMYKGANNCIMDKTEPKPLV